MALPTRFGNLMHIVDSHAHLDFSSYADDLDAVLTRALESDVKTILAVGIGDGPETMHRARDLAVKYRGNAAAPRIVCSAGIHPQEAAHANKASLAKLTTLAADPNVVAIGEIGLDYYHSDNPDIDVQQRAFLAQMEIALAVKKPILIHCRTSDLATPQAKERFGPADAQDDLLRLIAEHFSSEGGVGVMHCFSGSADEARHALDLGFYLSFAGNVTYSRFPSIREAAELVPSNRYLVETDAPFLAPVPHRGERNEPGRTRVTAEFVAGLRNISLEQLAAETTANFARLFDVTT
ncbi:TatD family hydrolase [Terriglobus roseus]|uniref:TatD DNase family protein n=1 Tax=Terriglobus roseus TaxID=392734 RepID=A0A1H4SXL2_9BACT|nr:TatD family hydrolase [Terriglobus roseus]SEC48913.1 TatD DNase family protein [Terriglobus roseus]